MNRRRALLCCGLTLAALAFGCTSKRKSDELGAKEVPPALANYSVPLDLREFEVNAAEGGYRGVFLKLSRLPTSVTTTSEENPPRIVVDIQGPTGTDSPWETFPGGDTYVTHVGVARHVGGLRVMLELAGDELPEYTIMPMADWVLVRIKPINPQKIPWAHRAS
jgi:hypothetical protein